MSNPHEKDEALFASLNKSKKNRRRRLVVTVVAILLVAAVVLFFVISSLQRQVTDRFAGLRTQVLSYQASRGTLSATVSGTGVLSEVGTEQLTVPAGVEIEEILVEANDTVAQGDVIATVDMSSVMKAMSALQTELDQLDAQIESAKDDEVDSSVTAGVSGRVKALFAQVGTDVSACMYENGALAVLSLDGCMALDIPAGDLAPGDTVVVVLSDGKKTDGWVDTVSQGTARVLLSDNGPKYQEEASVETAEGTALGSGILAIHNPLKITGFAGTVSKVRVSENEKVSASTRLFTLENTGYSANYDQLLRQRGDKEETLMELLTLYRDGAVLAPFAGSVSSVDQGEDSASSIPSEYLSGGMTVGTGSGATGDAVPVATLYPNERMEITISVAESNILSLAVGQEAKVTVSSIGDQTIAGVVTEIHQEANTLAGITQYSAVVSIPKSPGMLTGMTADVDVEITGVENAVLIPVDALHRTSAICYVFTSYDQEAQQYGGMVEVVPGLEGSNYVEIISGLEEGTTVYYTESQDFFFPFGGMGGFGGTGTSRPEGFAMGR